MRTVQDDERARRAAPPTPTTSGTKLTKTETTAGDDRTGYEVTDRETGDVLGIVYKKTTSHSVYGNGGRSPIRIGSTEDVRWHFQTGPAPGTYGGESRSEYTRTEAVEALIENLAKTVAIREAHPIEVAPEPIVTSGVTITDPTLDETGRETVDSKYHDRGVVTELREAAATLVDRGWTLSDLIDTLGEIDGLADEFDSLGTIIERGI